MGTIQCAVDAGLHTYRKYKIECHQIYQKSLKNYALFLVFDIINLMFVDIFFQGKVSFFQNTCKNTKQNTMLPLFDFYLYFYILCKNVFDKILK